MLILFWVSSSCTTSRRPQTLPARHPATVPAAAALQPRGWSLRFRERAFGVSQG